MDLVVQEFHRTACWRYIYWWRLLLLLIGSVSMLKYHIGVFPYCFLEVIFCCSRSSNVKHLSLINDLRTCCWCWQLQHCPYVSNLTTKLKIALVIYKKNLRLSLRCWGFVRGYFMIKLRIRGYVRVPFLVKTMTWVTSELAVFVRVQFLRLP